MSQWQSRQLLLSSACLCYAVLTSISPSVAQQASEARLTAPQLFPDTTLAYVRVDDVVKTREALQQSTLGKLGSDENLKPILSEFYGSLVNNTQQLQNAVGLNLDELLSLPSGELAIALLPADRPMGSVERSKQDGNTEVRVRITSPSIAILLDAGQEISGVQVILERLRTATAERMVTQEKQLERLTLVTFTNPNRARERFGYFIDGGVFVACTDLDGLERLANVWIGKSASGQSLADNRRFTSLLGRCVGTQGERPQISFYADPLAIAKQVAPPSAVSTTVFAVLPALGIDGIQAIGGSVILSPPDFDSISHLHVLLGSPRRSILGLLRPQSGSTTPENFVPESAASYFTMNWDIGATLKAVEQLYDQFRGNGAFDKEVIARASERVEFDVRKDFLENLQGRLTMLQGFVRPVRLNSGSNVYAIKLNNPRVFEETVLPKLIELAGRNNRPVGVEQFGSMQVNVFEPRPRRNAPQNSESIRLPEICFTIFDDCLIVSDSRFMMGEISKCISEPDSRLSETLDFQMISERVTAQLQGKECSALSYARPEESLQLFYELARDEKNIARLREMSKNNGFFKALVDALDKHKLPDFSVIAKYLAPGGGFLVDEETGLHYMSFSLRRE